MEEKNRKILKNIIQTTIEKLTDELSLLASECDPIAPDCCLGTLGRLEAISEQQVSQELIKQLEERLLRLKIANERIESSEFGLCCVCEDEIAFERLKLVPEAIKCIQCANDTI